MDSAGNIAMGYSVSSTNVHPDIRYTGRLTRDPAGQMTEPETQTLLMALLQMEAIVGVITQKWVLILQMIAHFGIPTCTTLHLRGLHGLHHSIRFVRNWLPNNYIVTFNFA